MKKFIKSKLVFKKTSFSPLPFALSLSKGIKRPHVKELGKQ